MRKINMGCGYRPKAHEGWIDIDNDPKVTPHILRDLKKGLPFDDNSVDEVYASHVMEHFTGEEILFIMQEIWRICKPGAIVKIYVPSPRFIEGAYQLDHRFVFTIKTFIVFRRDLNGVENYWHYNKGCFFKEIEVFEDLKGERHSEPQIYFTLEVDKTPEEAKKSWWVNES